jgi:predicted lipase
MYIMPDYSKAKIYKITDNTTGKTYIGSTTKERLCSRLTQHVSDYKAWKQGKKNFITSFEIIEGGNYTITLVETFPCSTKDELSARERHFIDSVEQCINKNIPSRSRKEYRDTNREILREKARQKQRHLLEKVKAYKSQKVVCACGAEVRKDSLSKHQKRLIHLSKLQLQEKVF